jgi:tryptophan halogenase
MSTNSLKKVVILGGGTAGWMTAAAMGKLLGSHYCEIVLVESDDIGTVGVGEATVPPMSIFNKTLEIDENDFLKNTQGTFKLGIEFVNWGKIGDRYIHAFGDVGKDMNSLHFYQYWLKMHLAGKAADFDEYGLNAKASQQNKFMRSENRGNSPLSNIAYAFHFDASLYAKYLRNYAEQRGVVRMEGKVQQVNLRPEDGFIESLLLKSGQVIAGDLFIDCSGFKALLIRDALNVGFEDWSHWLPCDRAWAVQCESATDLVPYTRSTAHAAGWQWRIPLQHRVGNGHVFSSKYMSEEKAREVLLENLESSPITEPRLIKFTAGKRKEIWHKNCVAIGLASGFLEPLESTSIFLVQSAIARLLALFPSNDFNQEDIDEFNRQSDFEYEKIRDFIILHYYVNERDDSEFWRYCRNMPVPEALSRKINLFKSSGRVFRQTVEMFCELSWVEVLLGQGITPQSYDPLVDRMSEDEIAQRLESVRQVIQRSVDYMPSHAEFIAHNCKAEKEM